SHRCPVRPHRRRRGQGRF
ncbi:hypothetical protein BN1708_018698, partial [Verticillium longisporum]